MKVSDAQWPFRKTSKPENYECARAERNAKQMSERTEMKTRINVTHEADDGAHDSCIVRSIRVEAARIREDTVVESLRLEALVEANVRDGDSEPGHQASNGGHVLEPPEDLAGTRLDTHEREERERGAEEDRDGRKTFL